MKYLILVVLILVGCKASVQNSDVKDLEAYQVSNGNRKVIYRDGDKVFVKDCEKDAKKNEAGQFTRKECQKDLGIEPISYDSYETKLFQFLKYEPIDNLEQKVTEVTNDLAGLKAAAKLEESEKGEAGKSTFVDEIQKAEKKLAELTAALTSSKTLKAQVDRIIEGLEAGTNTRLYFPGSDFNAALAPFGLNVAGSFVPGSCKKTNSLQMLFCDIPKGTFQMGSGNDDKDADSDEKPQHPVTLTKDFEMMSTEVTQKMWKDVLGADPKELAFPGNPTNPVERVSWNDITNDFLPKLNALLRSDGYTYRLPTEAEWEYAARAGTTTPFGIEGDIKEFAWFEGNSGRKTNPVASKKPGIDVAKANKFGLFDMHGNTWEWVQDAKAAYAAGAQTDPVNLGQAGSSRVVRGGSWFDAPRGCRSAIRIDFGPDFRGSGVGFRLVRTR